MSGIAKKIFKPIKKLWKGIKKVASKVWKAIKKPVLAAAAIYLTAGLATGVAMGSLSAGFSSVNSAIGGFFTSGASSSAGVGTATQTGVAQTAVSTPGLGLPIDPTGTLVAGTSTSGTAAGTIAGTGTGTTIAGATGEVAATEVAKTGFLEGVKNSVGEFAKGNIASGLKAGGDALATGAGNLWNAATGTAGAGMVTTGLLNGVGGYLNQRDAEKEEEKRRMQRSWWGMDGYGNTAPSDLSNMPQAPVLSSKVTTIDDLIRQSREGMG